MDLVALKYFTETARIGNLTKAAEKLEISPSAVYRQLKLLESELGVQLYNRTHYGLTLTSAGRELYIKALEILRLSDETVKLISGKSFVISEPLSIAFMDDTFSKEIAVYIDEFKQQNPRIKMLLYSGVRKHVKDLLDSNSADAACLYYYKTPVGVDHIYTGISKPVGLLMHRDDELKDRTIDSSVLKSIPLIVPQDEDSNPDRPDSGPFDRSASNIIAETTNIYSFRELAVLGKGYIFCIEPNEPDAGHPDLIFKPIYPKREAKLYFIKKDHPLHAESSSVFFRYLRSVYAPAESSVSPDHK